MDTHVCDRNVRLYYWYVIFNEPLFWGPILVLSLQRLAHMSLQDIYYMEGVVLFVCLALDIPSGALADVIGRRNMILLGRTFLFASTLLFALMQNPLHAWIANTFWAIGFSFQSGADTAFLYDTLKEHGRQNQYKRIDGSAVAYRLGFIAICSLASGLLAEFDMRLPLLLCVPWVLVSLLAAWRFEEPARMQRFSVRQHVQTLRAGVGAALQSKEVRWIVGFSA